MAFAITRTELFRVVHTRPGEGWRCRGCADLWARPCPHSPLQFLRGSKHRKCQQPLQALRQSGECTKDSWQEQRWLGQGRRRENKWHPACLDRPFDFEKE